MLGRDDEDQQRHQEQPERRRVARDAPLEIVLAQSSGLEEQGRQGAPEPAIEMQQAFDAFGHQAQDGAVAKIGGLAARRAVGAGQEGIAVRTERARRRRLVRFGLPLEHGAQSSGGQDLQLLDHASPLRPPADGGSARPVAQRLTVASGLAPAARCPHHQIGIVSERGASLFFLASKLFWFVMAPSHLLLWLVIGSANSRFS